MSISPMKVIYRLNSSDARGLDIFFLSTFSFVSSLDFNSCHNGYKTFVCFATPLNLSKYKHLIKI